MVSIQSDLQVPPFAAPELSASESPLPLPVYVRSRLVKGEELEESNLSSREKRKREFAIGRSSAQECLAEICIHEKIQTSADRCPVWPTGSVGSISHSENWIWAVVASTDDLHSIGIDTEPMIDQPTFSCLQQEIVSTDELRRMQEFGIDERLGFTISFSAKESLYKCIYQLEPVFFGFLDAEVLDWDSHRIIVAVDPDCPNRLSAGKEYVCNYQFSQHDVFTACWIDVPQD